jgi:hypothetical protein
MSLSVFAIYEMRSGSANTNGGAFDPGLNFTNTTLTSANGTSVFPTVSASNYSFVTADINHYLFIKSGASWTPGWYQITGLAGTSAVVNANIGQYMKITMFRGSTAGISTIDTLSAGNWTIDYSQSTNARAYYNDIYLNSTTSISSTGNTFYITSLGNTIRMVGKAGITTGSYLITGIAGTIATLDRTVGTSGINTGGAALGGANNNIQNTINDISNMTGSTNRIYVKADGIYNTSDNYYLFGGGYPHFIGYGNYRDDKIQASIAITSPNTVALKRWDGTWTRASNIILYSNNNINSNFASFNNNQPYSSFTNMTYYNMTNYNSGSGLQHRRSVFIDSPGTAGNYMENCTIKGTSNNFNAVYSSVTFIGCLFQNIFCNTLFWNNPNSLYTNINNIFYNIYGPGGNFSGNYNNFNANGNLGFSMNINNIIAKVKGTVYYNVSDYCALSFVNDSNAYFSFGALGNTAGNFYATSRNLQYNDYILNVDPFVNAENGDFRLNDHPQGGRLVRYRSTGNYIKDAVSRSNKDLGPYQTPNTAFQIGMNGGMRG